MQLDTEGTEAGRRGTEKCIAANATAMMISYLNPDFPRPKPGVRLCELLFALCGLCDEIDRLNLG
jgi:hypothetical protein